MTNTPSPAAAPARRQRDLRLDFFRGLAMFIILLAHTPGNAWTLWIPARFGFSDATEIFVFCSGMASGIAFGAVFIKKSWFLGTARILYRIWQVYWAHIGVVLVCAAMMYAFDTYGFGAPDKTYTQWFPVGGFFTRTGETLVGLFTLTYIPGLFDILPMYLVILGMVPIVMAVYRAGGREAVFAFVALTWLAANLAGYARAMEGETDLSPIQEGAAWLGSHFTWMNLPGIPWIDRATWFFNPFGWQLVFFTGFCFAMGWIPAPPVDRRLVWLAVAVVLVTVPFAWHKTYQYLTGYLPEHLGGGFLWDAREVIDPVRWKTWVGFWRYLHFLAIGYLAWAAVGPGGIRLTTGWGVRARTPAERRTIRLTTGAVLIVVAPYCLIDEIRVLAPALDRWILATLPVVEARYLGILQLIGLAALIPFVWHSVGDRVRQWLVRDAFLACVPVIRKVGTQSLAVFMVSIVLARFNGAWMDGIDHWLAQSGWTYMTQRDVWVLLMVNGTGFGVLIATAYIVGWFRRQPWRDMAPRAAAAPAAAPDRADKKERTGTVPAE